MAGTGHSYEVVNLDEVNSCLDELALNVSYHEGKEWLRSRHIIRIVTAKACVVRLDTSADQEIIRRNVKDENEAEILIRKLASGGDLRMFSRELFKHVGPDLRHLVDWLNGLPSANPKMIRKLSRISYSAALKHAELWVSKMAREASKLRGSEKTEILFEPSAGKVWLELLDRAALVGESATMNHCVADYAEHLGHGTRIFSLRNQYGKSVVTVEIIKSVAGVTAGQIRGFSNNAPSQEYRSDIVKLLNLLNVQRELYRDAERSAITRTDSGWTAMADVAERVNVHGFAGFRYAHVVYILSPDDLQSVIACIHGPALWWEREKKENLTVVVVGEARKHTLPEQRVLATLANDESNQVTISGASYLVKHEGRWTPWLDSCEKWDVDDVHVLYKNGVIYLPSASGRRIVARIEPPKKRERYLEVKGSEEDRRASPSDTRRLVRLMSALDIEMVTRDVYKQHVGIRRRIDSSKWFYVPDYAQERRTSIKKLEDRKLKWVVTPWHAALTTPYGSEECTIEFDDKVVFHIQLPYRATTSLMMEICKTMNALRLRPSTKHLVFCSTGNSDSFAPIEPKKAQDPYGVFHIDGRWRRISSVASFLQLSARLGTKRFTNESCNETALRIILSTDNPTLDQVTATHLGAWAHTVTPDDLRWRSSEYWSPKPSNYGNFQRLVLASKLLHMMSPKDRATVVKAVQTYLKSVIGRSKRPKLSFGSEKMVRDILLAFWDQFIERDLLRYIRWYLGGFDHLLDRVGDGVRIDPRWFDIKLTLKDAAISYAMKSHFRSAFWGIKHKDDKLIINSPGDAEAWLSALKSAPPESIYVEAAMHVMSRVMELIDDRRSPEWDAVRANALDLSRSFKSRLSVI